MAGIRVLNVSSTPDIVLGEYRHPAIGPGGGVGEPVADRLVGVGREHPVGEWDLRYDEAIRGRNTVRVQHGVEVVDEFGPVGLRDPGHDHAERGLTVPGVLQDLPDRPVGVPAGASHEQPQVRGIEELVGELVVRLHHRVDVRRVQQRDAARHALARSEHEQSVPAGPDQAFLPDPGQRGQEVVLGEPVDLVWVTGQDGAVRRRPTHAGGAHVRPDDAVHQGGFPGACGADQGDEHRRGGAAHPGQQVVVDLAEELATFGLDLGGTGDLEDERYRGDPLPQVEQGGLEQARVNPDVRLSGGPGSDRGDGRWVSRLRGSGGLGLRRGSGLVSSDRDGRELLGHWLAGLGLVGHGLVGHGLGRRGLGRRGLGGLGLGGLGLGRLGLRGFGPGGLGPSGLGPDGLGSRSYDGLGGLQRHGGELDGLGLAARRQGGFGRHGAGRGRGLGRRHCRWAVGGAVVCRGGAPRESVYRWSVYRWSVYRWSVYLGSVYRGGREAGRGLVMARILIPCDSTIVSIGINNVIQFVRFNLLRRQFRPRLLG